MKDSVLETIIGKSIQIGVVQTLSQLGLRDERVTEVEAKKMYGKRLIDQWQQKRWIVGYPTGNKQRGKVYFKRTELETASRMLDIQNIVPENKVFKVGN